MAGAAAALRITQSAVSKRIAALEAELGRRLCQRSGRRVVLTAEGSRLLAGISPLLAELRSVVAGERAPESGALVVGVSESILGSWGAAVLAQAAREVPGLSLELHAHRSPVVLERVRAGEYVAGLCAGVSEQAPDLEAVVVGAEPMVLVGRDVARPRSGLPLRVLTIEPRSATWESLARPARRLGIVPQQTMESFFAVAALARAGYAVGLVPIGVARALALPREIVVALPPPGLARPVSMVARRSTLARPLVGALREVLARRVPDAIRRSGGDAAGGDRATGRRASTERDGRPRRRRR